MLMAPSFVLVSPITRRSAVLVHFSRPLTTTARHVLVRGRSISTSNSGTSCDARDEIVGTIPRGGQGIEISQYAEIRKIFTADDVLLYGRLVGDRNPLHLQGHMRENDGASAVHNALSVDDRLVKIRQQDGQPEAVVHGMLVGSLFSAIFGTLIPGSVYRSQRLRFCAPVFAAEPVLGRVSVVNVKVLRGRGSLLTCDTTVVSYPDDESLVKACVEGEAEVWLPGIM